MSILKPWNRRTFIKASVGAAGALSTLAPNASQAQSSQPKRLLLIFTPDGTIHDQWRPTGSLSDFTLPPILKPFEDAGLRDDMVVLDGVRRLTRGSGDGHEQGMTQMWSAVRNAGNGRSTGPSIDEFVHQRISDGRPALRLGVRAANYVSNWTRCSFNDAGNPINPRNDPYKARDDVFSGFTPTEPGEDPEQDRQFELRSSVLNYAKSKLTHMNNRLSPADQVRLSGHISGFNAIKNAPPEAPTLACSMAAVDAWERGVDPDRSANYPKVLRMQMELVLAAFSCDAARVATLQLGQSNSTIHHTWADSDADAEHHSITHYNSGYSNPRRSRVLANIYRWHAEQFAWLIAEMKRMGLLENTVVAWSSEMGEGDSHASTEIPWVLFGDGGGYFRTGSYANYLQTSGAHIPGERGVSHCDVLTSLCESMGAPPPGGKFGDPNSGYGPLKLIT